jgi:hypothetical protein
MFGRRARPKEPFPPQNNSIDPSALPPVDYLIRSDNRSIRYVEWSDLIIGHGRNNSLSQLTSGVVMTNKSVKPVSIGSLETIVRLNVTKSVDEWKARSTTRDQKFLLGEKEKVIVQLEKALEGYKKKCEALSNLLKHNAS